MSKNKEKEEIVKEESTNTSEIGGEETTVEGEKVTEVTIEELQAKLAEKIAETEENTNRLMRLQADFDNFRRRSQKEREEFVKYAVEGLVSSLLPVLDNFERALVAQEDDGGNFRAGVEMIFRQLKDSLEAEGVKVIEAVGCEFDPNCHEAVMQIPSDEHEDNTVIEEFQRGYLLKDKVIRPAMVKVAKN